MAQKTESKAQNGSKERVCGPKERPKGKSGIEAAQKRLIGPDESSGPKEKKQTQRTPSWPISWCKRVFWNTSK